jgi:hypothetical protein
MQKMKTNRTIRRLLAIGLVAAATALVTARPGEALPMCGYQLTWYSTPAKTFAVGWRYVAPESCGCYVSDVGQHTPYYTVVSNATCWLPD